MWRLPLQGDRPGRRGAGAPERPAVLQVVGRRVDISLLGPWNGREPATRIVAIGAAGSIDAEDLRRRFDGRVGT